MVGITYLLFAFVGFYIFMKRAQQFWRLDTMDLLGGVFMGLLWPLYFMNLLVLRLFNGNWK